jgi:hypothetical protein
VKNWVRIFSNLIRSFPGRPALSHEPVPATLAEKEGVGFINLLLQLRWIRFLDFLKQIFQFIIDIFRGFEQDSVKIRDDLDLGDIDQMSGGEFFATS